jgi:hypothetical protein
METLFSTVSDSDWFAVLCLIPIYGLMFLFGLSFLIMLLFDIVFKRTARIKLHVFGLLYLIPALILCLPWIFSFNVNIDSYLTSIPFALLPFLFLFIFHYKNYQSFKK